MRVLIVSTDFPPLVGGIGTFAYNAAKAIQEVGVSVHVLTSVGLGGQERVQDVEITRTPSFLNKRFLKVGPLLGAALWHCCRHHPDKLLAMAWTHEGVVACCVKKLLGISYSVVAHGSEILQHQETRLRRTLMLRILGGADMVIANSQFTRRLLLALGFKTGRVVVVNPPTPQLEGLGGLDMKEVDEKFDLKGKRVILTAARLVRRKGHKQVIQVLGELRDRYPDLVYVMTGEGDYRQELEDLALRHGVADRVKMIGYVLPSELRQLYHRAELYISPSQEDQDERDVEGFGIALAEAGVYGKPVIAGRSGGVSDVVVDGEIGFLVNPSDIEETKRALVALLDDADLRERFGKAGRARALNEFGLRKQGEKLKHVLQFGQEAQIVPV